MPIITEEREHYIHLENIMLELERYEKIVREVIDEVELAIRERKNNKIKFFRKRMIEYHKQWNYMNDHLKAVIEEQPSRRFVEKGLCQRCKDLNFNLWIDIQFALR